MIQNLILDGCKKAGTFAHVDEVKDELHLSNIRILNQYIDVARGKTKGVLHFIRAETEEDPNDDGNWVQIVTLKQDYGMGIFTGQGLWVGHRHSTFEQAKFTKTKDANAN